MAGNFTLEGKNGQLALTMLQKVTDLLDKHHIDYWLEGGTLLGVIRENRLLPWDNDLDISIKEEAWPQLEKALKKINYLVSTKQFKEDNPPFKKGITRIVKVRSRRLYFCRGEITLDIFIKFKKDGIYHWQVGNKPKSVPAHFSANFITHAFAGKNYKIPEDSQAYLTHRYGDWETPVKEWNTYTDDNAINGES